jgi:hypothetical protein
VVSSEPMLKKNRSAPNTAVIPVLYYPDVGEAVEWLTTALPFMERLRNSANRRQLLHNNGAIVVTKPGGNANDASSTQRSPRGIPLRFVLRGSTNSFYAPRQQGHVFSLNPRITHMANANVRSSTHGDIRGHFRRRFPIPTQPTGAVNSWLNKCAVEPRQCCLSIAVGLLGFTKPRSWLRPPLFVAM